MITRAGQLFVSECEVDAICRERYRTGGLAISDLSPISHCHFGGGPSTPAIPKIRHWCSLRRDARHPRELTVLC